MMGLVLWYNPKPGVGIVWCEDQGPLAYIGPEVQVLYDSASLESGMQLVFRFEEVEGVRYVREIFSVSETTGGAELRDALAGYHDALNARPLLRVVA